MADIYSDYAASLGLDTAKASAATADAEVKSTPAAHLVSEVEADRAATDAPDFDSNVEVISVAETTPESQASSPVAALAAQLPLRKLTRLGVAAAVAAVLVFLGLNVMPYYGLNIEAIQELNNRAGLTNDVASTPYALVNGVPAPLVTTLVAEGLNIEVLENANQAYLLEAAARHDIEIVYLDEITMTAAEASAIDESQGLGALPVDTAVMTTVVAGALALATVVLRDRNVVLAAFAGGGALLAAYKGALGSVSYMQVVPIFGGRAFGGTYYVALAGQMAAAAGVLIILAAAAYVGVPALRTGVPVAWRLFRSKISGLASRGLTAVASAIGAAIAAANADRGSDDSSADDVVSATSADTGGD